MDCVSYLQLFKMNLKTYEELEVEGYRINDEEGYLDKKGVTFSQQFGHLFIVYSKNQQLENVQSEVFYQEEKALSAA